MLTFSLDGPRIRELWKQREPDKSERVLADTAGISQGHLSKIIKGERVRKATAVRIAKALGVDLSDIVPISQRHLLPSLAKKSGRTGTRLEKSSEKLSKLGNYADYIRRVEEVHREAKGAGRRKDDLVPLIQLMAALRRITASEDWAKRSAVIQILLAFDPEIRDRWPEIQDAEVAELRRLLATGDVERQRE